MQMHEAPNLRFAHIDLVHLMLTADREADPCRKQRLLAQANGLRALINEPDPSVIVTEADVAMAEDRF